MSLDTPLASAADWTEAGPLTPITDEEHQRLLGLEEVIDAGLISFVAVGTALTEVRDDRLYREQYPTFEAYCADRWGISRPRAYELMSAAVVVSGMPDTGPVPVNPRQANALAAADPAERADVMAAVAGKGKPTAAAITDEIKARHPEPEPPAPSPAGVPVETGRVPSAAPPVSPPTAQVEPDDACQHCGEITPDVTGGWCAQCWQDTAKTPEPVPLPAAKPPKLRDLPEVKAVDRLWAAEKALGKALRTFPSADDVMAELPADSLESFDHLADEAAAWAKKWKEDRKSASRLRLMGVKGVRR